jgi:hypothetical protein
MNHELLDEAVNALELLTIKLHENSLTRQDFFDSQSASDMDCRIESMSHIKSYLFDVVTEAQEEEKVFRILATFGLRGLRGRDDSDGTKKPNENDSQVPPSESEMFCIEATFRAEYRVRKSASKEALKEFGQFNAPHNIWPFWREHVYSTIAKADLPEVQIGLFPRGGAN